MPALINGTVPVFEPGGDDARLSLLNRATPLAPPPTAADAADWHRQNLADTWEAAKDPQFWQEAADQYRNALLMGSVAPGAKTATMDNPAFARWFGKSKAVDETGNPATYYHGTNSDFDTFQRIDGGNQYGEGHYFTKSPSSASGYATGDVNRITPEGNARPNVMPVKLAFDRPYDRRGILSPADIQSLERAANAIEPGKWKRGELARMFDKPYPPNGDNVAYELGNNANEIIRKAGFDAIVDPHMTVVFKPTQIKSAIGNSGKFDPKDPRITAGVGGLTLGGGAAAGAGGQDQQP